MFFQPFSPMFSGPQHSGPVITYLPKCRRKHRKQYRRQQPYRVTARRAARRRQKG